MTKNFDKLELKLINEAISIIDEEKKKDCGDLKACKDLISTVFKMYIDEEKEKDCEDLKPCKNLISNIFKMHGFMDKNKIQSQKIEIAIGYVNSLTFNGLDKTKRLLNNLKSDIIIETIDSEIEKLKKPKMCYPICIFISTILIDCALAGIGLYVYQNIFKELSKELKLYIYIFLVIMIILLFVIILLGMYSMLKHYKDKYKNMSDYYYNKLNYLEKKKREFYGFN